MAAIAMIILGEGKTRDGMGVKMIQAKHFVCLQSPDHVCKSVMAAW